MASFRQRNGRWQVRIQRSGIPSVARSFTTLSDAKLWARKIEHELDLGFIPVKNYPCLKELLKKYLVTVTPLKKNHQPEIYRIQKWMASSLAHYQINQIKSQHLAQWRDEKIQQGLSANSIRLYFAVLSHLFTVAKTEWGYEQLNNPLINLKRPRLTHKIILRISDDDIHRLIKHTQSIHLKMILPLAIHTGMRSGEIAKLAWHDVDLLKRTLLIRESKNHSQRLIILNDRLCQLFQSLDATNEGLIFNMTSHAIGVAFYRAAKRCGLSHLHFHMLRHEAITRMFEKKMSIPEVAAISGHKTWAMLKRYTHLSPVFNLNHDTN